MSVFWQEIDSRHESKSDSRVEGMLITTDAPSYMAPAINWIESGRWKDNSLGPSSYCQRPPGYGMIIGISYLVSPEHYPFFLKILQIIAFIGSVLLIAKILSKLGVSDRVGLIAMIIYGVLPCYSSTMYFILTEGITPFLILASTFYFIKVIDNHSGSVGFIILNAFLLLVRPQLLVFVLLIAAFVFVKKKKLRFFVPLIFMPLVLWQIRSYSYTSQWNLHPIYSSYNQSFYRPPHEAMTNLFRIWESDGSNYHEIISELISDSTESGLENAITRVPEKYRPEIRDIMREYQILLADQNQKLRSGTWLLPDKTEQDLTDRIDLKVSELRKEHLFDFIVVTPFHSSFYLLSKSHLHQHVFQKYWRGNIAVEALRIICLLVISISLILTISLLFAGGIPQKLKILSLTVIITILYLVFIQRLNEERYMSPYLPLMFLIGVYMVSKFFGLNDKGNWEK